MRFLYDLLIQKDKITTFSHIFIEILHHYRKELDERSKRGKIFIYNILTISLENLKEKDEKTQKTVITNINKFEETVKNQNIIYQSDLQSLLFKKLTEDKVDRLFRFLLEII